MVEAEAVIELFEPMRPQLAEYFDDIFLLDGGSLVNQLPQDAPVLRIDHQAAGSRLDGKRNVKP